MLIGRYIVLIEDDALMGSSLLQRLELEGAEITWVKQAVRGIAAVRTPRRPVDAVVCDIRLPDGTGEEVFKAVSQSVAPPPFLFITGQGDIEQAVRLLRAGGSDYMTKPFEMPAFLSRLAQILRPESVAGLPPQTGISPLARQVDGQIADAAGHDRPVLVCGQRGLGKARIARRIHDLSDRRAAPFAKLDAVRDGGAGLNEAMQAAADGTLFIHGIGRLDPDSQARLVQALAAPSFRLIAASGTRIAEKVAAGGFRADLIYALTANEIVVPPLSQRPEDAAWLAGQMFQALNARRAQPLQGLTDLAMAAIRDHGWPGQRRELRARLLRAMDAAQGGRIFPSDLFPERNGEDREIRPLSEVRAVAERQQIVRALDHTGGQVTEAARLLKVSRTTLWEKMQKLGL